MEQNKRITQEEIIAKQNQVINICYDRLLDVLHETTNETTIMKCIETIRKDMLAIIAPANSKQNALNDTYERVAEIEKQLQKL